MVGGARAAARVADSNPVDESPQENLPDFDYSDFDAFPAPRRELPRTPPNLQDNGRTLENVNALPKCSISTRYLDRFIYFFVELKNYAPCVIQTRSSGVDFIIPFTL